jgi:hypothetical protein
VFYDYLEKVKMHYYKEKKKTIDKNLKVMVAIGHGQLDLLQPEEIEEGEQAYKDLEIRYGYDRLSGFKCLQYLMKHRPPEAAKDDVFYL